MATAKAMTGNEWRERALAIAERDDLYATYERVDYDENDTNGVQTYTVPSRSEAGKVYHVTYELATGQTACECKAAQHHLPCGHQGAVLWEREAYEANLRTWLAATGRPGRTGR